MGRYDTKQGGGKDAWETLVAIPSPADPYVAGGLAGVELAGPILAALQAGSFRKTILLSAEEIAPRVQACVEAIRDRHAQTAVDVRDLRVVDLHDPGAVQAGMERLLADVSPEGGLSLLAAPSYPYVHAAFLTCLSKRTFRARVIDVSRPAHPSPHPPVLRVLATSSPVPGKEGMVREPSAVYVHRKTVASDQDLAGGAEEARSGEALTAEAAATRLGFVCEHPSMQRLLETVGSVAAHQVPMLIQGETGTGKGLCARLVHTLSPMRAGPFVAVNCGALPEQLIESQLFGHRQGAFTGASRDQAGKFEQADGGTLFLDEIGELPLVLQPKLLRVLEDGVVEPLGETNGRSVNVRIIAATNRDLRGAVASREFREDLYYRLAFAVVPIPSLRDRRSDIPALALQFLARINASLKAPRTLSAGALTRLTRLPWRGNVRDLENVIGRSVLLSENDPLTAEDLVVDGPQPLEADVPGLPKLGTGFDLEEYVSQIRRALVERALVATEGNQRAAAELLGISPQAVSRHVKERRLA